MKKAYGWQIKAFEKFRNAKAVMLDVCCGGGKSFAAVMFARHHALPTIIVAPKNLCEETWKAELLEAGVPEEDVFVYSQPAHTKGKKEYEDKFTEWLKA